MAANLLDITVDTWLELQAIEADTEFNRACEIISILKDLPMDEVMELPYDEAMRTAYELQALNLAMGKSAEYVVIDDESLYPLDFNQLEFGAFIDIEAMIQGDYKHNVHKILAVLYRRKISHGSDLYPPQYEAYDTWATHRSNLFLNVKIKDVYSQLSQYIGWRQRLLEHYKGLFESEGEDDSNTDTEESTARLTSEESKALAREKRLKKWGWELMLWKLASEDPMKMEEATKMSVVHALNILSMKQELEM